MSKEKDFDPVYGNVIHEYGKDPEADEAWDRMVEEQENEHERLAIALEREHAERLGVLEEFEKHIKEGRFRKFMPRLNYLKLQEERKRERKAYLIIGLVVGFIIAWLVLTWQSN